MERKEENTVGGIAQEVEREPKVMLSLVNAITSPTLLRMVGEDAVCLLHSPVMMLRVA